MNEGEIKTLQVLLEKFETTLSKHVGLSVLVEQIDFKVLKAAITVALRHKHEIAGQENTSIEQL